MANEQDPPPVNPTVKQDPPESPGIVKRTPIKAPKATGAPNPKENEKQTREIQTKISTLEDRVDGLEGAFAEINSMLESGARPRRSAAPEVGIGDLDKDIFGEG